MKTILLLAILAMLPSCVGSHRPKPQVVRSTTLMSVPGRFGAAPSVQPVTVETPYENQSYVKGVEGLFSN